MHLRILRFAPVGSDVAPSQLEWTAYTDAMIGRAFQFHDPADGPFTVYRERTPRGRPMLLASPGAVAALSRSGFGAFQQSGDIHESQVATAEFEKCR